MHREGFPPSAEELRAWLRLNHTDGIGAVRGRRLLQCLGPPEAVLEGGVGPVADVLRSASLAGALFRHDPVREAVVGAALDWLQGALRFDAPWDRPADRPAVGRSILVLPDPRYPPRLLDLADPPLLLYCVGDPEWLSRPQIAIVGSRNATALGAQTAHELAGALASGGWTVVSGLAEGIDQAAHEGALAASGHAGGDRPPVAGEGETARRPGSTVGVLGTGIDRIYPSRHARLARRIAAHGVLLTEQPVGMPPLSANFPRRNRLIAALGNGVLVVEANLRSGSLITARLAAEIGREVMAVPGSIHSPLARGGHSLIRQGAKLVESAEDILTELPGIRQAGLRFGSETHLEPRPGSVPRVAAGSAVGLASDPMPGYEILGQPASPPSASTVVPVGGMAAALPEEQALMLAAMSADPVRLETLAARQRLTVSRALAALHTLEVGGLVARQLDGTYVRCVPASPVEPDGSMDLRTRLS